MNTKFNKIAKTAAVGIFFMALMMNVKVSLTDPFVFLSNDALAQTTSSSSSSSSSVKYCFTCEGSVGTCYSVNGNPAAYGKATLPVPC